MLKDQCIVSSTLYYIISSMKTRYLLLQLELAKLNYFDDHYNDVII